MINNGIDKNGVRNGVKNKDRNKMCHSGLDLACPILDTGESRDKPGFPLKNCGNDEKAEWNIQCIKC